MFLEVTMTLCVCGTRRTIYLDTLLDTTVHISTIYIILLQEVASCVEISSLFPKRYIVLH